MADEMCEACKHWGRDKMPAAMRAVFPFEETPEKWGMCMVVAERPALTVSTFGCEQWQERGNG